MGKKNNSKKRTRKKNEIWTEEQHEEYIMDLYDMDFVTGYTEGGVPYGNFIIEEKKYFNEVNPSQRMSNDDEVDIPF
jgi:hypothetical protein